MNTGLSIFGGVVVLVGLGLLWLWKKYYDEGALMAATATSSAADVSGLAPGAIVEVKGNIRCQQPLIGEYSKQACVYHRSVIEREEVRYRDGKRETSTVTERENVQHVPFYVEDESGRVWVNPQGASIEAAPVFDESADSVAADLASLATSLLGAGSTDRRYKESILAPDIPVYVLGTVQDDRTIGAAPKGANVRDFIVSYKSEEERAKDTRLMQWVLMIGSLGVFAFAAWLFYQAAIKP